MKKCVVFDVYGTLLDIGSPVARLKDRVGSDAPRLADLWRAKQLEYAWVAAFTGRYETFWALTERALSHAIQAIGIKSDGTLEAELLKDYQAPDLYEEIPDVLAELERDGHRLVVFSNGNPAMLETALSSVGIIERFEQIISVDPVRLFKPNQAVYAYATEQLSDWRDSIVFLSSNGWDISGAEAFGWTTYWVNRKNAAFEFGERDSATTISTLADLPEKLR